MEHVSQVFVQPPVHVSDLIAPAPESVYLAGVNLAVIQIMMIVQMSVMIALTGCVHLLARLVFHVDTSVVSLTYFVC